MTARSRETAKKGVLEPARLGMMHRHDYGPEERQRIPGRGRSCDATGAQSAAEMRPSPSHRCAPLRTSSHGFPPPRSTQAGARETFTSSSQRPHFPWFPPTAALSPSTLGLAGAASDWDWSGSSGVFDAAAPGPGASGNLTRSGHSVSLRGPSYSMVSPLCP